MICGQRLMATITVTDILSTLVLCIETIAIARYLGIKIINEEYAEEYVL
jgi:hypothetical protein